jgi:hypothetical protein
VRATNFAGYDEWLLLWLGARGIADCPYASRPLGFLWSIPGALLTPYGLEGYRLVHAAYFWLAGCWTLLLVGRLAPGDRALALLSGAFAVCWAPLDMARLTPIQMATHSGVTCCSYLALLLFVSSWQRRSRALLGLACALALVAGRSYESPLPLLLCAPLLALLPEPGAGRRLVWWSAPWLLVVLVCGALFLRPWLAGGADVSYQGSVLKSDWSVTGYASRLLAQFGYHLAPLVTLPRARLDVPAVALALAAYALAFRAGARSSETRSRGEYAVLAGAGLILAGLGYSVFVVSPFFAAPHRMQMLSAPGIAIALAAALRGLSLPARAPWRGALAGLLGAWVVAVGTARTFAMQKQWDETSYYPAQRGTLSQLVALAPDLQPNTLVVLLDAGGAWPATFGFRHAVEHFYAGHATGVVWGAFDFLYPLRVTPSGLRCETWPVIRKPWGVAPTEHRWDELLLLARDARGAVSLLESWPAGALPPLPAGARYDPRSRIRGGGAAPLERRVLARER